MGDSDDVVDDDDDKDDIDFSDPTAELNLKCGICNQKLVYGHSDKNDAPWIMCSDQDKFKYMTYQQSLDFHQLAPDLVDKKFRYPFPKGRPRCKCGDIMAYHRVLKASDKNMKILNNAIFLLCHVKVADGGPCESVTFAGQADSKKRKPLWRRYSGKNRP